MAFSMAFGSMAPVRTCRQHVFSGSKLPSSVLRHPRALQGCAAPRPCLSRQQRVDVVAAGGTKVAPTVKVIIQGRKLQVTDAIKAYVEEKVSKACGHFTQGIKQVDVSLSARGGDTGTQGKKEQKVEVTIHTLRNGVVRVEDAEESLYAAIDLVCDKIERKLTRTKEKAIAKGRWHAHAAHADEDEFKEYIDTVKYETKVYEEDQALQQQFAQLNKVYPAQIRRTKKVELDLMTVDEAIDAMDAVGHDFFVFRDMEEDTIQVVYRRQDEGYGIIVPVNRT